MSWLQPVWTRRQGVWGGCILAAAAAGLYAGAARNDFVNWDDFSYVVHNVLIRNLDRATVGAAFSHFYFSLYTPLVWISYMVDYQLWPRLMGTLPLDPFGFHFQNIIWYAATAPVVFALLRRLWGDARVAWITAALWMAHPTHVESVAWVTERKDVMFGFFFFAALLGYVRYRQEGDRKWYAASVCLFAASCLSKITAVILPVVLLLVDWLLEQKPWRQRRQWLEKIPFFVVSLAVGGASTLVLWGLVRHETGAVERLTLATQGLLFYLAKSFWPQELAAHYPIPRTAGDLPWAEIVFALAAAVGMGSLLWRRGKQRMVLFCAGLFLLNLLPVLQLLPVAAHLAADRYLYVSSLGVCWMTTAAFWQANKKLAIASSAAVLILWSVWTLRHIPLWSDSIRLWSDVVQKYPYSHTGYFGLAREYGRRGETDRERAAWNQAVNLLPAADREALRQLDQRVAEGRYEEMEAMFRNQPQQTDPYRALFYAAAAERLAQKGQNRDAAQFYRKTVALVPGDHSNWKKMAFALASSEQCREAAEVFAKILRWYPNDAESWAQLGLCHLRLNQISRGRNALMRALRYDPAQVPAALALAQDYFDRGAWPDASAVLAATAQRDGFRPGLWAALGRCRLRQGNLDGALEAFRRAVALAPRDAEARKNLGATLYAKGLFAAAAEQFQKALTLEEGRADLWASWATTLEQMGKSEEAAHAWQQAVRLDPANEEYRRRLGEL